MNKKCNKVDNSCREEKLGCENCAYNENGTVIKAKYKIGQKIWVVDANKDDKVVEVYSDIIDGIFIDSKGDVYYYLADICDDIIESKLIPFEDTDTLSKAIIKADNEINTKEGE